MDSDFKNKDTGLPNNPFVGGALSLALVCCTLEMSLGINTFSYFAYGSNMLARRIHINNPTAVRQGIARLENYRLDFLTYSNRWKGAAATIVRQPGAHIWGVLWEIDMKDLEHLDRQEGVDANIYYRFTVNVSLPDGGKKKCYIYEQCKSPPDLESFDQLPSDRQPSTVYLRVMLEGAKESGLPADYIEHLKKIPHNGYNGNVDIGLALNQTS